MNQHLRCRKEGKRDTKEDKYDAHTVATADHRVSTKNRKVLHFVVYEDFHTDLPLLKMKQTSADLF